MSTRLHIRLPSCFTNIFAAHSRRSIRLPRKKWTLLDVVPQLLMRRSCSGSLFYTWADVEWESLAEDDWRPDCLTDLVVEARGKNPGRARQCHSRRTSRRQNRRTHASAHAAASAREAIKDEGSRAWLQTTFRVAYNRWARHWGCRSSCV